MRRCYALAGALLGIHVRILCRFKQRRQNRSNEKYGAEVILAGERHSTIQNKLLWKRCHVAVRVFVSPFDDRAVMEGAERLG